jgi:hypothetical protein
MRRPDLVSDCASCAGLCCIATSFEVSEYFGLDKPAGMACPHLASDCRCSIHDDLVGRGFAGCAAYECFGAGPRVTRVFGRGADPEVRNQVFLDLRVVHELLWLLTEAAELCPPLRPDVRAVLEREIESLDALAQGPPAEWLDLDLDSRTASARAALRRVGAALRAGVPS